MTEETRSDQPGRRRSGLIRVLLFVAVLVVVAALVLAETLSLGIGHARRTLAGGYFNTVGRDLTLGIGVAVTVLLGLLAIAQRHRRPRVGVLIAIGLAAGWLGWAVGYATGSADGPAAEYTGSARISTGSHVLGSLSIACSSVVGDPALLAGFGMRTNGFELNLRNTLDRTFNPGIDGGANLSGVTVSFGTASYVADASGFIPIGEVAEDGLDGRATVPAVVTQGSPASGSDALVTIEWSCDPATRRYP